MTTPLVEKLVKFFQIDGGWLEHLLDRDFKCECASLVSYDKDYVWCEEYILIREIHNTEVKLATSKEHLVALVQHRDATDQAAQTLSARSAVGSYEVPKTP